MKKWKLLLSLLGASLAVEATEIAPWFGNDKEFDLNTSYVYQTYDKVDGKYGAEDMSSNDHMLNFSLGITPDSVFAGEAELLLVKSDFRSFGVDSFAFTGRKQLMNDVVGDPFSLVTGVTMTLPTNKGSHDMSTIHHADVDTEFHVSIGKEVSSGKYWLHRSWTSMGYLLSNIGSPAFRSKTLFEKNINNHRFKFFGEAFYGLGKKELDVTKDFRGYGSLNHQTIDVGAAYTYNLGYGREISAGYERRLHAHSAPARVNRFCLNYLYTFSPVVVNSSVK